jgi:mannose-6-phosphate isomerase-like protein (cupin superfamily)
MLKSLLKTSGLLLLVILNRVALGQTQTPPSNGVSGASTDANAVKYFSKDDVAASFAKGGTLVTESNYKVMTARRTETGNVEIHHSYTDVFYIVQGSTTIVTGGKVVGEKDTNSDEPRADSTEGGETHHLSTGDVIVIPAGVPHWMKDVHGTLLYFVVKVKKPEA